MDKLDYDNISSAKNFAISDFNSRFGPIKTIVNELVDTVTVLESSGTGGSGSGNLSGYVTETELQTALSGYAVSDHSHSNYLTTSSASNTYLTKSSASTSYASKNHTHSDYLTQDVADVRYTLRGESSGSGGGGGSTWTSLPKEEASPSFTLEADTEYTCVELTSLTITADSFKGEAIVNFKSGSTATTFTCTSAKMIGLNCFGGTFTPAAKMCYTIMFDYDGTNVVGYVGGYTNA